MTAIFVTATGTDIGKTYVTEGIVRTLRFSRRPVAALKPVLSGFDMENAASSDSGRLLTALGRAITPIEIEGISPWRFKAPLSPDMAARRGGSVIDFDALLEFSRARIDAAAVSGGTLLIEGVGGIMVPLDDRHTVLDWMAALNLPVLLVAGSYLGTISHTLTALDLLVRRGLRVLSLIVSESAGSTVDLDETATTIRRFAPPESAIFTLPRLAGDGASHAVFAHLAALF